MGSTTEVKFFTTTVTFPMERTTIKRRLIQGSSWCLTVTYPWLEQQILVVNSEVNLLDAILHLIPRLLSSWMCSAMESTDPGRQHAKIELPPTHAWTHKSKTEETVTMYMLSNNTYPSWPLLGWCADMKLFVIRLRQQQQLPAVAMIGTSFLRPLPTTFYLPVYSLATTVSSSLSSWPLRSLIPSRIR